MTRLIINADDFGLTAGVNRSIIELHQAGVLTSATLMARAPMSDEAIRIARATPTLGVGCHVVLVDGEPDQPADRLPSLCADGRFHKSLGSFLRRLLSGRISATEIEREARAQIEHLQSQGVALTHVDTHKHTHMFPQVLRPVLRAAKGCGVRSIRNPFEPGWSVAATPGAPWVRQLEIRLLRSLRGQFERIVREEGFRTTSGALGVLATGTLDAETVRALLAAMPRGLSDQTFELVTHPGYHDDALSRAGTRLLRSREIERNALLSLSFEGVALVNFTETSNAPS